jgi:thioredoxin-related protein
MIIRQILLILLCAPAWVIAATAADARDPYTHFFNPNTGDIKAELADAKNAGKKAVFLMFEQEGCPGCLHMKHHVLNQPDVQQFYREHFLNFAIDIYGSVPVIDFAGRGLTEKSYAQSLKVKATPTLAFYDLDGSEVLRVVGPVREAGEFLLLGEFVASGAYKTRQFAEFKQARVRKKGG